MPNAGSLEGRYLAHCAMLLIGVVLISLGCDTDRSHPTLPVVAAPDTIPPSWGGIWLVRARAQDCETSAMVTDTTVTDTLCSGRPVTDVFGIGTSLLCPGATLEVAGSTGVLECRQHWTAGSCSGLLHVSLEMTFDAEAGVMNGSGTVDFVPQPVTGSCASTCTDVTLTGVRIGSSAANCPSAGP